MKKLGIALLAAASAMVGILGASGAAVAAPTVTRPGIITADFGGAQVAVSNVHYRYVETTFTVPRSPNLPYSTGGGLVVQLRSPGEVFQLGIFATPGSYWTAKALDTAGTFAKADTQIVKGGDSVTLSAYYNAGTGYMYYNMTDHTSGAVFAGRFSDPGALFGAVRAGAEFAATPGGTPGSTFIRPPGSYRLAVLNGVKITQLNGTRVNLNASADVIETSTGTADGRVQVAAPTVFNNGTSTGIWVFH